MSSSAVIILVVASVVLAVVVLAVGLVVLLRRRKERGAAEIASTYADPLLAPELGMYRGGTGAYSSVRTTVWLVLTDDVLAMHPLLGGTPTKVDVQEITRVRREKAWRGHWNGRPVVVLTTKDGELGITVDDPDAWEAALHRARR